MTKTLIKSLPKISRRNMIKFLGAGGAAMMTPFAPKAQEMNHQDSRESAVQHVAELFTSQGCSSCPPADALLTKLAKDPHVLALSIPVDYWDYLGWKDTLAHPFGSNRQRAYAVMRGDRDVFTPQVIINGTRQAIGSNLGEVTQSLATNAGLTLPLSLKLTDQNGDLHLTLAPSTIAGKSKLEEKTATLILMGLIREAHVTIERGENAGATMTYTNVVSSLTAIGTLTIPRQLSQDFDVPQARNLAQNLGADVNGYVVLVQEGTLDNPGAILAASPVRPYGVQAVQVNSVKQ